MQVNRYFKLEIARHGPPHNQLLSPLAPYLALCGNHSAGTVRLPFEHREFLSRLRHLRYRQKDQNQRRETLDQTARDMSDILAQAPGLASELGTGQCSKGDLVHMRLVLSAEELALLPFEMALAWQGCPGAGSPLLLQPIQAITMTREVRQFTGGPTFWPRHPRILFAAADPRRQGIPFMEHYQTLLEAVRPWFHGHDPADEESLKREVDRHLVLIEEASLDAIRAACSTGVFTHVHILAHGIEIGEDLDRRFGLALHQSGERLAVDKVDGARLAAALRTNRRDGSGLAGPAVVTVASCDSGNVGSVIVPGASLAHDLHMAGIPFVVASQFPLTFAGSVLMTRILYGQLLEGQDPRVVLHDLRRQLYQSESETHDWASIVAYAALPADLPRQLNECRYLRAKAAVDAALDRLDYQIATRMIFSSEKRGVDFKGEPLDKEALEGSLTELEAAMERLPNLQSNEIESIGIRASAHKRKSQLLSVASKRASEEEDQMDFRNRSESALNEARQLYRQAFTQSLGNHWTGVQYLSLCAVLGRPVEPSLWTVNRVSAEMDLDSPSALTRAWAHGSLAEIFLLGLLLDDPRKGHKKECRTKALSHIMKLIEQSPEPFPIQSTYRQFLRYRDWWTGGRLKELKPLVKKIIVAFEKDADFSLEIGR